MMRISFTGIMKNAIAAMESMRDKLINSADDDEDADDAHNDAGTIETCLSAYHDTILAIVKGDVTLEQVKDFWFDGREVEQIPYRGGVLTITPKEGVPT